MLLKRHGWVWGSVLLCLGSRRKGHRYSCCRKLCTLSGNRNWAHTHDMSAGDSTGPDQLLIQSNASLPQTGVQFTPAREASVDSGSWGDQEERGYPHSKPLEKAHLPSLPAFGSGCVSSSQSLASWSLWGPGVPASDPPLLSSPDPEELLLGSSATPSSSSLLLASSLEELSYLRTG